MPTCCTQYITDKMLEVCVRAERAVKRTDDAFLMNVGAIYFVAVSYTTTTATVLLNAMCSVLIVIVFRSSRTATILHSCD